MRHYAGLDLLVHRIDEAGHAEIIGGLRTTDMELVNQLVDATHVESDGYRSLLPGAGLQSMQVQARGLYTHMPAEQKLMKDALNRKMQRYCLIFGNGMKVSGNFMISQYGRSGDHDTEETYEITWESSGPLLVEGG